MSEMMLQNIQEEEEEEPSVGENDEDEFRMGSLQSELDRRNNNNNLESPSTSVVLTEEKEEEFDGYAMRDVIYEKWGACFDVDFQRVDAFGVSELYMDLIQSFEYFSQINGGTNTWGRIIILSYCIYSNMIVFSF
jgi:hypothetical protein